MGPVKVPIRVQEEPPGVPGVPGQRSNSSSPSGVSQGIKRLPLPALVLESRTRRPKTVNRTCRFVQYLGPGTGADFG